MKKLLSFTFFVAITPFVAVAGILYAFDCFKQRKQTYEDILTFTGRPEYEKDNGIW